MNIIERIKKGEILIADGAIGTLLMQRGLKLGECPEIINLRQPDILEEIAQLYLEAGAEIIQTNTFGASPLRLSHSLLDEKTEEINRIAVQAVRKAVGTTSFISASCGPSGKLLKPYGDTEPEAIRESFHRQFAVLIEEGIDTICIETMTDLTEATLAVRAAKALSSNVPVIATMTFDATPRGFFTIMGVTIEQAVKGLEQAGADIIGSNCGNGIENMIRIAAEFKKFTCLPLIIQSNAGLPIMKDTTPFYPETPEFMAEKSKELVRLGVSIIGGCCGTTSAHIKAIRKALKP
ncbi:MAG: hypothetical protein A2Y62_18555 [Candidatus Fischerbacteria bacterium RBG_13_37_8]|uniref:Hcy-binding domain-containing protein n=1 Tax=Candidatus Fischerbacteria bacterium RBG_13_37_8 TaxID=1817863 RepID=A0A1F5V4G9_9BACT|nr:MAG: hypothetical protein A2Y62_18555 [Candidatus Fischerbacteria bacterium RBG_13_37_8]